MSLLKRRFLTVADTMLKNLFMKFQPVYCKTIPLYSIEMPHQSYLE